jgi:hypothetical protein
MRLRLDINGYMEGHNSHMSLFLDHVRGEYDSQLTWPFDAEVTFTLLNMSESENYACTKRLHFTRPGSTCNGLKQFVSHNMMPRFVMKDSIFIKCEVKGI